MTTFAPAVKAQLKARLALDGPTGSGKTWTALSMATVLADGGTIAVIDTERDSARKYANHFAFDVAAFPPPYNVHGLVDMLHEADNGGYAVVVIDSLSHFWIGEGGVLDEVDAAAARAQGNKFAGWNHGTPLQRHLVDSILALDLHVIATMRSKMEYVQEKDERDRTVVRKVGMQPVQREGLEYEFDVIGDLDLEHRITITKSRCDVLADTVVQPGREDEAAKTFLDWLNDGEPPPPRASVEKVAGFLEVVKAADEPVRTAMNAWWKARGLVSERLTIPELDEARAQLDAITKSQGSGEADVGDDSAGHVGAGATSPGSANVPTDEEEAMAAAGAICFRCGSGRTKRVLDAQQRSRCANTKDCDARVAAQSNPCSVDGCAKAAVTDGYCKDHEPL